jgi:mercuric ion transport protein
MLKHISTVGAIIAGMACFTPVLVVLFGVTSLGWLTGYTEYIVIPILFLFLGMMIYARQREKPSKQNS